MNKLSAWKNYSIRYEFKILKDDIQLLVYMNEVLAFTSKKNSFEKKDITEYKIQLNKWHLPQYKPYDKSILIWKNKNEQNRFINFAKRFKYKTCVKLQEELILKMSNYNKLTII